MTAHAALRAATRAAHDQVDAAYAQWDLKDRDDYAAFLRAHATAFVPVEAALGAAGIDAHVADWRERQRTSLLLADLADLGIALPAPDPFDFANPAEMLGGAYVLEGSRLGGAMLRKSVAPDLPTRFLSPSSRTGHWRDFLAMLEHSLISDVQRNQAVVGAHKVFDQFLRAALVPTE